MKKTRHCVLFAMVVMTSMFAMAIGGKILVAQDLSTFAKNPDNFDHFDGVFSDIPQGISVLLQNKDFFDINFHNASQKTIDDLLKDVKMMPLAVAGNLSPSLKMSGQKPLPLKLYKKKRTQKIENEAEKRIKQAYSYLKKKDFKAFQGIILDIILRHHFSSSSAQAAFLAAWSLINRDPKNPYRYFDETIAFFDYVIKAHQYTKYSDGSLMLIIPWLLKKDKKTSQMLLEKYIKLQGKIEKIHWQEELDIHEEAQGVFISAKKSEKIINNFLNAVVAIIKIENHKLHQTKQNWKKKRHRRKIVKYLQYLQQFLKKPKQ